MKPINALVLGIVSLTLFITGCATRPHPPEHAALSPAARPQTPDFLLISATYGSGTHFADVTARVNELLRPGTMFFTRPEWLIADPTPGWNKSLVIIYEHDGHRELFATEEGGKVSLDELLKPKRHHAKKKKESDK